MVASRAFALDVTQPGGVSLDQDWQALSQAVTAFTVHAAAELGFTSGGLLQWLAVIAAIYLLVLDKTGWRTNLLTALLVPYLALQLPEPFFGYLRGDIGKWIAFIAVVIRLFFASQFSETIHGDLELPAAFILLIVVAPSVIVGVRGTVISSIICLIIGTYLLVQHIQNAGGFKRAFGETRGVLHTVGILLLFIAPAWAFLKWVF